MSMLSDVWDAVQKPLRTAALVGALGATSGCVGVAYPVGVPASPRFSPVPDPALRGYQRCVSQGQVFLVPPGQRCFIRPRGW